jgi:carboxyl-terminal processing protease
MEVKLTPSEYVKWFLGRRERDLKSAAKGRSNKPATAKADADKDKKEEKEKAKAKDQEKGKSEGKTKARLSHDSAGPFVDKVLDKALEVMRAKLAKDAKAKAA